MTKTKLYSYLLGAGALFLVWMVFFGPVTKEDTKKAWLWKTDWEKIEYKELASDSEKNEEEDSALAPEKQIFFYRRPGLKKDRYFVHAPEARDHTRPERRRGNAQLTNLFRDWRSPEDKGLYKATPDLKKKLGLLKPVAQISFYKSEDAAKPDVYVFLGEKQKSGNYFIEIHEGQNEPLLALVAGYIVNRLRYDLDRYRERRFLTYPAGSYLQHITVQFQSGENPARTLRLLQEQTKEEEKKVVTKYYRIDAARKIELPPNLVQPLLGAIKGIQIKRFSDESELSNYRTKKMPKSRFLQIQLSIENSHGDLFKAGLARPNESILDKDKTLLAYFQNLQDGFIDYAELRTLDKIKNFSLQILNYKEPPKAAPKKAAPAKPTS